MTLDTHTYLGHLRTYVNDKKYVEANGQPLADLINPSILEI